jgi:drug/metabolite transporter (DMT)-like permease
MSEAKTTEIVDNATILRDVTASRSLQRPKLGIGLSLLAMGCFAGIDAATKWLAPNYAVAQILWFRYAVFTLFALVMTRSIGTRAAMRSVRPWLQAGRGLLLVVESGVFVVAVHNLPLAQVHAIAAASPLIVTVLSAPVLGESIGVRHWLAVTAGFAGVCLIVRPGFHHLEWPVLVPLAGAGLWAGYQILVRYCSRFDSSETTLLWSAAMGLAAMSLVGPMQWRAPDAVGWTLLLLISLLGSLGHYMLIKALQFAEARVLQPFSYTLLVWATALGVVVFGSVPDLWTIAGAAIVVGSGLYAWRQEGWRSDHP